MPTKVKHPFDQQEIGTAWLDWSHPLAWGSLSAVCLVISANVGYAPPMPSSWNSLVAEIGENVILGLSGLVIGYGTGSLWRVARKALYARFLRYQRWITHPKSIQTKVWGLLLPFLRGQRPFGTFQFQQLLPKLPLPRLTDTLDRWLSVAEMYQDKDEFERTKEYVEDFRENQGPKLQRFLQQKADKEDNWIHDYWLNLAYLSSRKPLPVYNNYFMGNAHEREGIQQLARAATLTHHMVKFERLLSEEKLAPVFIQDLVPLCMEGFKYLFNSNRIPGEYLDEIVRYPGHGHIIVIRKGVFFKLDVYHTDSEGNRTVCSPHELKTQFEAITRQVDAACGDHQSHDVAVTSLTAQDRTVWAMDREKLAKNNASVLGDIDTAMFCITLDHRTPKGNDDFMHKQLVGENIWFDKCFTTIIYENGWAGTNVEHSALDAMIFTILQEYITLFESYDGSDVIKTGEPRSLPQPKRLDWRLNGLEEVIAKAQMSHQQLSDDIQVHTITPPYGKGFMKKQRISPDGYIQMCMQLAYYRMHKRFAKTYEPSTARMFLLGRTDTVHPGSLTSQTWVKAMCDESVSRDRLVELLRQSVKLQTARRLQATVGQGCDRHLLALMCAARELGMDMPNIFKDKPWVMPFTMSTSQAPNMFSEYGCHVNFDVCHGGFGPTADDGYGVGYCVFGDNKINFQISCWNRCQDTDAFKLAKHIAQAFEDVKALFQ